MIYMTPFSGEEVYEANSKLLLGDRFTLGYYEQDDNTENGPEPIEWVVLGVTEEKAFLTTVERLTVRSEIETEAAVDWGWDKLKIWLNTEFFQSALPKEVRDLMQSTTYDEIAKYCKQLDSSKKSSEEEPDLEACQVGFIKPTLSFYMDDTKPEGSRMVFTDFLINPVIVLARDGAFVK